MFALFCFVLAVLASPFKSKSRLEAENMALRNQLNVLRRQVPERVWLTNNDRWFFVQLYRWFPSMLQVLTVVRPETVVRWHRAGFRYYWRWKSHSRGERPPIETDLRLLIRRMNKENPLWGAPRIHGELLKLGFQVAQSTVAKYMVKRGGPPSQGWRTFLHNHAPAHRRRRHVRSANHRFQAPLCHRDHAAGSAPPRVDQRHHKSDRRMDRAPDHQGIPVGSGTSISASGSQQVLRGNRSSPIASYGDP